MIEWMRAPADICGCSRPSALPKQRLQPEKLPETTPRVIQTAAVSVRYSAPGQFGDLGFPEQRFSVHGAARGNAASAAQFRSRPFGVRSREDISHCRAEPPAIWGSPCG